MKDTHIDVDHCIQEALQGNIVYLDDNLYLVSAEKFLYLSMFAVQHRIGSLDMSCLSRFKTNRN